MNENIKWLREKLKSQDLQGMIVSNPINIKYLTGIESEGVLLITLKENIFITDSRYTEAVNTVLTIEDEILVNDKRHLSKEDYAGFFIFCENVGFEEKYVTYYDYKNMMQTYRVNLTETEGIIENQRAIKDDEEISCIRKACKITDDCFEYLKTFIKKGMTEKEIAFEIERYMITNGADDVSFEPIVASGHNSSMPHAIPTTRKIKEGDIIILDFGCKYKGYCSDMTRTVFIDYVEDMYKEVYELVLKNNKMTINDIKEGSSIKAITRNSNEDLKLNGYMAMHSPGHGVGLEVHEQPALSINTDNNLKANMVVTVEPGIYVHGRFGVRIEDTVLVTRGGSVRLTESSKDYTIIKNNV
ncbi:MAG: aminopeptidase P family protein [Clostridia bacterium]|nr:aminopeptidase P family protein [Clostridia bacterium]